MRPQDCTPGTVVLLGHPANNILVAMNQSGQWINLGSRNIVDPEDFKAGWDIYVSESTALAKGI